ncbi:hypothetical protein CERZMDRAFT_80741 [Cercospora zeae-maydis SCOH1-5]|uniref:Uncharacterized protein n=1 Tax=Cercospora zeae-maydis SCOH1-5 TaxID=717836 RepID=A0A6A6FU11_9PEZI|nr:hypothetical protein CERZMDRAFT_80741 [Cercospora zeae-maydis SCOH1-5]
MSCRRRISGSAARDAVCSHLYTRHAQWLAAYQVVKVLHQDRAAAEAIRIEASHAQQIGDEAPSATVNATLSPTTDEHQETQHCSTPIEQPELLWPGLSFDATSISRVNDLLTRVTQLEQQLAQSQSDTRSQQDEITSLSQSQARLQQLLTTACHELMSVGSQSLAEGSTFRGTMIVDASSFMNTYLQPPPTMQFPQTQSITINGAMQQTTAGMPCHFGPINTWDPGNANYPTTMLNGPGSDYHSHPSSGPRK